MKAANKPQDLIDTYGASFICVSTMRIVSGIVGIIGDQIGEASTEEQFYRDKASFGRMFGCGNCGEQAAVAFFFAKSRKITPIDLMAYADDRHAFLVIGRSGSPYYYDQWGKDAVVCDPWDNAVFQAVEVPGKLKDWKTDSMFDVALSA